MTARKRLIFGGLITLAVLGIVVFLIFTFAANPNRSGVMNVNNQAQAKGLAEAQFAGLIGAPDRVTTTLTNLADYTRVSSNGTSEAGPDASEVGLNPDLQVWVVAFEGDVRLSLPGASGRTYDNITFALDAKTGEVIGVSAYVGGKAAAPYLQ